VLTPDLPPLLVVLAFRFSYSSVLGCFVAYISKGRKVWHVVVCTLVGPIFFCILSSSILGGLGLRQLRQAMEMMVLGETHFNNSAHFLVDGSEICYNVPQEDIVLGDETVFTNYLSSVSPVCLLDAANPSSAMYNVLDSFHVSKSLTEDGLSTFLSVLFLLGCTVFYTSHSDSATFIVDTIASNGRKNYHWTRRMFWSGNVAALATALLSTSGANALASIVAATIIGSLPMTILLCFLLQSVTLFCQAAEKLKDTKDSTEYVFPDQPTFGMPVYGGVFNAVEYVVSLGRVNTARVELEMHQPKRAHVVEFVKGLVTPFVSLNQVLSRTYSNSPKTNAAVVVCYTLAYVGWISLALASTAYPGLKGVATSAFLLAGAIGLSFALQHSQQLRG
jgi:choline-glycine betaine transporter